MWEHRYTEEEKAYILGAAKIVVLPMGAGCVASSAVLLLSQQVYEVIAGSHCGF